MSDVWIVAAVRTPVGRYGGALAHVRPDDLAAATLAALVDRAGVPAAEVDEIVLGAANQAGEDNRDVARMAALLAGFPIEVPGITVNRLCASGLDAVAAGARAIRAGEAQLVAAGGVESMTRAPWVQAKPERAFPRGGSESFDTAIGWRFVNPEMLKRYGVESMGETAENLAQEYGLGREEQDRFALHSHRKALAAREHGLGREQIVAIEGRDGEPVTLDEGPRRDASAERLAALRPAFRPGGTVTAGNSSSLNDGAAALLLCSEDYGRVHGMQPLARIAGAAAAGVAPRTMGIGPVPATAKLCRRLGLTLADVGLIELNEAFAAQVLSVLREWDVDAEDERLNPRGGAIAIGHPLGCSGARILCDAVHGMQADASVERALVTMCVGVGQGVAMLVERVR